MSSFTNDWDASRRLFILRLLVEADGEANESVIFSSASKGGFARDPRDTIRQDINHLREVGCVGEAWLDGRLRVVRISERGEDAAYGRIGVAGVQRSRWDR